MTDMYLNDLGLRQKMEYRLLLMRKRDEQEKQLKEARNQYEETLKKIEENDIVIRDGMKIRDIDNLVYGNCLAVLDYSGVLRNSKEPSSQPKIRFMICYTVEPTRKEDRSED